MVFFFQVSDANQLLFVCSWFRDTCTRLASQRSGLGPRGRALETMLVTYVLLQSYDDL